MSTSWPATCPAHRCVPWRRMPGWVQTVASYLPFESCFGFPITALVGPITNDELAGLPTIPYHYASYVFPAALARFGLPDERIHVGREHVVAAADAADQGRPHGEAVAVDLDVVK